MVVRMFPADYRMDVISPLQTAMAGYQAGFGQFQQLDDVRRQREADRMAAELHDAKMAEYERATAAAQAAQLEQAAFYEGFADGTHTPESLRRFRMSQNEIIREIAGEQLASLDEDARRSQFDRRAQLAVAFQRDPDTAISMLEQEREAALNAGDQDTVNIIDGFLPIVRNDPAAGDAVAYQLAMRVGTDDEMDNLDNLLAFGQPEQYESAMDALGVRRYTEGPKTGEIVPGFEAERPRDQQMGFRTVTRPDGTTEVMYGPLGDGDIGETGRVAPGYTQVRVQLSDGRVEPVQRVIAGSEQEDAVINDLVRANRMVADIEAALNHPAMPSRFGVVGAFTQPGALPTLPGTGMPEAEGLLSQVQGAVFLQAFEQLKGGGQITEIEGQKATQSQSRLNQRGMTWEAAQKALNEMRDVAINAQLRARAKLPPSTYEQFFGEDAERQAEGRGAGISRDEDLFAKYGITE